ncbi:MAG TPA: acyl carrier protein, partial [Candidatus Solibacter sp.]|nr:acyl carrier protein [Candidatus Solibacter sp.]
LQELAARVLGLPDAVAADRTKPLHELGMDSLMAVEIRNFIGAAVGRTPPATLLFDYPTVDGISGYLRAEVLRMEFADAATQGAAPQAARNDSRADRVADLTQMDEDEVQELLVGKLRAWTKGKSA